jgi:hypothetical protein
MLRVTQGPADFRIPKDMPEGKVWRYGLGLPFQVAPKLAGIFLNIRSDYEPTWDFEAGSDIVLFDDMSNLNLDRVYPVSRNHFEPDPVTGEPLEMVKYPVWGGFVPYGAKRADGSPHPHAGTGFGIVEVVPYDGKAEDIYERPSHMEMLQFVYDGKDIQVLSTELMDKEFAPGFNSVVPDGDDLLYPICTPGGSGFVSRWKHGPNGWRLSDRYPIPDSEGWEPSLIRDVDDSLLYCCRKGYDIRVWRSEDLTNWTQVIFAERVRGETPITINRAPDGSPYVASGHHQEMFEDSMGVYSWGREILCIWPLNKERNGLEPGRVIRMPRLEFGAPPGNTYWLVDHPLSNTVQLADGEWHNILAYRFMELCENALVWCFKGAGNPPPHTGCCLEEVFSDGPARPLWNF